MLSFNARPTQRTTTSSAYVTCNGLVTTHVLFVMTYKKATRGEHKNITRHTTGGMLTCGVNVCLCVFSCLVTLHTCMKICQVCEVYISTSVRNFKSLLPACVMSTKQGCIVTRTILCNVIVFIHAGQKTDMARESMRYVSTMCIE